MIKIPLQQIVIGENTILSSKSRIDLAGFLLLREENQLKILSAHSLWYLWTRKYV